MSTTIMARFLHEELQARCVPYVRLEDCEAIMTSVVGKTSVLAERVASQLCQNERQPEQE